MFSFYFVSSHAHRGLDGNAYKAAAGRGTCESRQAKDGGSAQRKPSWQLARPGGGFSLPIRKARVVCWQRLGRTADPFQTTKDTRAPLLRNCLPDGDRGKTVESSDTGGECDATTMARCFSMEIEAGTDGSPGAVQPTNPAWPGWVCRVRPPPEKICNRSLGKC